MQKIIPFMWFEHQSEEAAQFYVSLFDNSRVGMITRYGDLGPGPKGSVMTVSFQLAGQDFMALNGGPVFSFSPAISYFVSCDSPDEIDRLWGRLSEGGSVLMELGAYPFSSRFGWLTDRYGVSWQLNLERRVQKIAPFFMFVGSQHGKAEQAIHHYMSQIENSRMVEIQRYGKGEPEKEGTVKRAVFSLGGVEFMAIDSGYPHAFAFTPAISLFVNCETQAEVDRLWERLSDGGQPNRCGWLSDRYGVAWQIVPTILGKLLHQSDPQTSARVMKAMLGMTKLDIAGLEQASRQH